MIEPKKLELHFISEPHGPKVESRPNTNKDNSISEFPDLPGSNQKDFHEESDLRSPSRLQYSSMNIQHHVPSKLQLLPVSHRKRAGKKRWLISSSEPVAHNTQATPDWTLKFLLLSITLVFCLSTIISQAKTLTRGVHWLFQRIEKVLGTCRVVKAMS